MPLELKTLSDIWPVIVTCLGGLAWLVRLEAKVLYLDKDREEHWEKIDDMQRKLDKISDSLARLEGKLENK
jgi:hypothetical protein